MYMNFYQHKPNHNVNISIFVAAIIYF